VNQDISVEDAAGRFLAHKRALGRKYHSEECELRLLSRFAAGQNAAGLGDLTPAMLEEFLGARPRNRPRSFNHLLGVTGGLFRWAVAQELLEAAPALPRPRKAASGRVPFLFTAVQARDLLAAAARLPDNARARGRGHVYQTVFALCYGLGLRAAEACGIRLGDIDAGRNLIEVRGGKFGKDRLVPHGPRIGAVPAIPQPAPLPRCSPSTAGGASIPAPPARSSIISSPCSACPFRTASPPRDCMISAIPLRSGACCAGIAKTVTRSRGCTSCPRSWDMSTPSPQRST
jgi:hypothetical protein